jgi:UDP-N-acetylglucosamine 4,6-dehydratase/5-epimerase
MLLDGKRILITGGTGSFARHFLQHILSTHKPEKVVIYSRDEHKQTELLGQYGGIRGDAANSCVRGFIGDIRDLDRLRMAMENIDIVIHAAALKQVQSCEYNPLETVKTNIQGSQNVIQAALDCNVEKVLAISTDKAVAPLNLYGSTKMVMEKLMINANGYRGKNHRTKFACTRYGNVADSRGTVVHIWRDQVSRGVPVSVTDFDATRFWLTMKEANQFVVDCIELMDDLDGGEIFCPRIPSVTVRSIFNTVVPDKYEHKIIGQRIGDKAHEDLILKEELLHTTLYKGKYVILPEDPSWPYRKPVIIGPNVSLKENLTSGNNEKFIDSEEIRQTL